MEAKKNKGARLTPAAVAKFAGFCEGCKNQCHGGHLKHVVDLYSKRIFRCDCGNESMSNQCVLNAGKEEREQKMLNYNQNFVGRYCRCHQGEIPGDEMLQCALCEDWFHMGCWKKPTGHCRPGDPDIDQCDFTCVECSKVARLAPYFAVFGVLRPGLHRSKIEKAKTLFGAGCTRPELDRETTEEYEEWDMFWLPGFRKRLCRCQGCLEMYKNCGVPELVDEDDIVRNTGVNSCSSPKKVGVVEPGDLGRDTDAEDVSKSTTAHIPRLQIKMTSPSDEHATNQTMAEVKVKDEDECVLANSFEADDEALADLAVNTAAGASEEASGYQVTFSPEASPDADMNDVDNEIAASYGYSPLSTGGLHEDKMADRSETEHETNAQAGGETNAAVGGEGDVGEGVRTVRSAPGNMAADLGKRLPYGLKGHIHQRVEQFLEQLMQTPGQKTLSGEDVRKHLANIHDEITTGKIDRGEQEQ